MKTKKSRAQKDEVISCYCFVLFFSPWSAMLDLGHIGIPIGKGYCCVIALFLLSQHLLKEVVSNFKVKRIGLHRCCQAFVKFYFTPCPRLFWHIDTWQHHYPGPLH